MEKYRYTTLLLALLLAAGTMLAGCGGNETADTGHSAETIPADTTTETTADEDSYVPHNIPSDLKFGGADFHMLSPDEYGGISLVEEANGEVLNDAKFQMELNTEEALDVVITETPSPFWDMVTTVNALAMSGDGTYDCITMMDRFALQCAQQSCFMPIQDVDYIDLSKIYWGGELSDTLTVGGNSYFAISSFNLKSFEDTSCIYFNTTLGDDLGVKAPTELVYSGTWTMDALLKLADGISSDLNGDGAMTEADRFAFGAIDQRPIAASFWIASDELVVHKDDKDIPYVAAYGSEKFVSILEWVYKVFYQSGDMILGLPENDLSSIFLFMEGQELMSIANFRIIGDLREMEDNFTILPMPKYDAAQANYVSRTFDSMFSMVPVAAKDSAMSGAVLEVLSCEGYNHMLPAYLETSLQEKYSRDSDSVQCIQICFDTRRIDLAEVFMFDVFGDQFIYDKLMNTASLGVTSYLDSQSKIIDKAVSDFVELMTGE